MDAFDFLPNGVYEKITASVRSGIKKKEKEVAAALEKLVGWQDEDSYLEITVQLKIKYEPSFKVYCDLEPSDAKQSEKDTDSD